MHLTCFYHFSESLLTMDYESFFQELESESYCVVSEYRFILTEIMFNIIRCNGRFLKFTVSVRVMSKTVILESLPITTTTCYISSYPVSTSIFTVCATSPLP